MAKCINPLRERNLFLIEGYAMGKLQTLKTVFFNTQLHLAKAKKRA